MGNITMGDIHHFPVYAQSFSGRMPVRRADTLYHSGGGITAGAVDYVYTSRGSALERPARVHSERMESGGVEHRVDYLYADDLCGDAESGPSALLLQSVHVLTPALQTRYYVSRDDLVPVLPSVPAIPAFYLAAFPRDTTDRPGRIPGGIGDIHINDSLVFGPGLPIRRTGTLWRRDVVDYGLVSVPPAVGAASVMAGVPGSVDALLPLSRREYTDGRLSWREDVLGRDCLGNISQFRERGRAQTVLVWGCGGRYPLAVVENAGVRQVDSLLSGMGVSIDSLTLSSRPSAAALAALDSLRDLLPGALVSTYEYEPGVGMTRLTDAAGVTMRFSYDAAGRLSLVSDAGENPVEGYEYRLLCDPAVSVGRLSVRSRTYVSEGGGGYREHVRWWNTLGERLEDIAVGASPSGGDLVTAYSSDFLLHDDSRVWLPYPAGDTGGEYVDGAPSASASWHSSPQAYHASHYERSRLDRLLSSARPGFDGQHERIYSTGDSGTPFPHYEWRGRSVVQLGSYGLSEIETGSVTDEDGRQVRTCRDRLGRVLGRSTGSDSPAYRIYDLYGQLRAVAGSGVDVTDTLHMWRFGYDSLGRLSSRAAPGCARESYRYDRNDRVAEEHRYRGPFRTYSRLAEYGPAGMPAGYTDISYRYDSKGRPVWTAARHSDGGVLTENLEYTFAGAVKEYSYDANGRLAMDRVNEVQTHYSYDPRGTCSRTGTWRSSTTGTCCVPA